MKVEIPNHLLVKVSGMVSRGIKEAEINEEGILVFTLTDGTKIELGSVKGDQGPRGESGVYVGTGEMPEGCNVQIDPSGEAFEFIQPPKTASIGQALLVKSVDETGKPTEWETGEVQAGSGGTSDHQKLSNRDAADQHPIGAITGLEAALDGKQPAGRYLTDKDLDSTITMEGKAADAKAVGDALRSLSEEIANKPNVDNQYSTLYMLSPNGTVYKVKISDAGTLYVDGVASDEEILDDLLPGRILAWHDEFDGTQLSDVWSHEIGYVRNNEIQYYTDDASNCYVADSILNLVALKNSPAVGYDWSSASVITRQKYAFYRGLIEAKIKITPNVGFWPAFWAKGDSYYCTFNPLNSMGEKWPHCGEVDVCELVGSSPTMRPGCFWYNELLGSQKRTNTGTTVSVDDGWHIYGWERTDTEFNFYFDREPMGSIDISALPYAEELHRAMYIQFNIAVGGGAVGNPEDSIGESSCMVDWVRAYLPKDATTIVNPNFTLDCGDSFALNPSKIRHLRPVWDSDSGSNYAVEWDSDNTSVATVYGGKVTAISAGTANISATDANGKIATAQITVGSDSVNLVESVVIKNVPESLNYGDSITLAAYVEPEYATDLSVTWASSDTNIATVVDGVVTAINSDGGTATITCSSVDGGASASVSIKCNSEEIIDNIDTTNVIAKYTRNGMSTDRTWSDDTGNCETFDFANMSYDTSYKIHYDSPYGYYGKTGSGARTSSIKPTNYFAVCDVPETFTLFFVFYYKGVSNGANQCLGAFTDGSSAFNGLIALRNGTVNFGSSTSTTLPINSGYNYAAITYDGNTVTVYVNSIDNTDSSSKQSKSKIALTGYGQAFGADDMSGFILYDGIKTTDEITAIFSQLAEMYE